MKYLPLDNRKRTTSQYLYIFDNIYIGNAQPVNIYIFFNHRSFHNNNKLAFVVTIS